MGKGRVSLDAPRTQQLTSNFYAWEQRGRGWQVWDHPVVLEPAFEPFYHRLTPQPQPVLDDSRHPNAVSSLFESLAEKYWKPLVRHLQPYEQDTSPSSVATTALFESAKPEFGLSDSPPPAFEDESDPKAITISLSPDQKISLEQAEQFILNLSYCSLPLSFEIIGTSDSIRIQWALRDSDLFQMRHQLQAYFPDAVISEEGDTLKEAWDIQKEVAIIDFGLSQEFMRPLRTFTDLGFDPLIGIVGALEHLEQGEVGVLQVLFQSARQPWPENIYRSVTDLHGRSFFVDSPEMVKFAREKIETPLFGVVIRVAGLSGRGDKAWEIAKALGGGLTQFSSPHSNELIPLSNDNYDDTDHQVDLLLRQSHRGGMLLNSQELVSLVHPPSASVRAIKLQRELKKTKAAPAIATQHQYLLGENIHQGRRVQVTLSPEQRLRHLYLIGATGTGKSTLLCNLVLQDIKAGLGVAVLDPHGDLIDRILGQIPEERAQDVVLLDPSDAEYPVGFNILSAHSEIEKNVIASDLVAGFRRLSTSWGDQMTSVLGNAILAFLESTEGGTLIDLRRFLVDREYRNTFLKTVTDPEIVYYWQKEFSLLRGNPQASILTRLDTFLRPKLIRNMVSQKKGLNFQEIANTKKIFLAKLSQGLIGEENAYLLGTLIVSKLHQVAMARQAQSVFEREHFYLYIDEFHNFITPSMAAILSGARKYHLGLVLAHQELRQLWNRDTEVANAVISNPGTRICFRLGDFDAQKLSDGFSFFDTQDLQNLGVGEAICRIERTEYDFTLKVPAPQEIDAELARKRQEEIVALSREKYSRSRGEVEAALARIRDREREVEGEERTEVELKQKETRAKQEQKKEKEEKKGTKEDKEIRFPVRHVAEPQPTEEPIEEEAIKQPEKAERREIALPIFKTQRTRTAERQTGQGKGGPQHKYLQALIKRMAEDKGYRAIIEQPTPDGGQVDVGLEREGKRIACEISLTSTGEYELGNIEKCLKAGYDQIISCSPEKKTLDRIKPLVNQKLSESDREKVLFLQPEELFFFFEEEPAMEAGREETVKGYRVKVQYQAVGVTEKKAKREAVGQVITQALRRLQGGK